MDHPACWIISHLDAFSAASMMFLTAFLMSSPSTPSILRALISDWPTNPLHLSSMGFHQILHPLLQPASSSYLALFFSKASSIQSCQGTVNSSRTTCLVISDTKTMSGLSVVTAMFSGNLSCFPRSTFSCQSCAVALIASGAGVGSPQLSQRRCSVLLVAGIYCRRSQS